MSLEEVDGENIGSLIQDRRLGGDNEDSRRNRLDELDNQDEEVRKEDEVFDDTNEQTDEFGRKRSFSKVNAPLTTSREKDDHNDRDNNYNNKRSRDSRGGYRGSSNYNNNNNNDNRNNRGGRPQRENYNNNNNNYQNNNHNNNNRNNNNNRDDRRFNSNNNNNGKRSSFPPDNNMFSPPPPHGIPPPPIVANMVPINNVFPIMSFKSFMQNQSEDLPPDVYQKRYDEYNIEYINEFSNSFFNASKGEEWFQDRYNPLSIIKIERETCEWAKQESLTILNHVKENHVEFIKAVCLDPREIKYKPNNKHSNATTEKAEKEDSTETQDTSSVIDGKHFSGHENRALYVTGIHACCPKQFFKTVIVDALAANKEPLPAPERILIAQPVWSTRNLEKFERSAWIIMPTVESAKQALQTLKDYKVIVPGPIDPIRGDPNPKVAFIFNISVTINTIRSYNVNLPNYMSHSLRVQSDTNRSAELAALLDEERKVPMESRLKVILEEGDVIGAFKKPTDRLDLSIAYLRRVHFLAFYGAKRYRDEAHLLTFAPSVVHRHKHYVPLPSEFTPAPPTVPRPVKDEEKKGEAVEEQENNEEGKDEEQQDDQEPKEDVVVVVSETKAEVEEGEEGEEGEIVDPDKPVVKSTYKKNPRLPTIPLFDNRIDFIVNDLKAKRRIRELRLNDPMVPGDQDEDDAKVLEEMHEKSYLSCMESSCKIEKEDKARCCYQFCGKLFKDVVFLRKHLQSKHPSFATDVFLVEAEPYMRKRYETEDISFRPLPPVEVEVQGTIELKSVKEIRDKYLLPQPPIPMAPPLMIHQGNTPFMGHQQQGPMYSLGRGNQPFITNTNRKIRRSTIPHGDNNTSFQPPSSEHVYHQDKRPSLEYVGPKSEDNNSRKIQSYLDVDAPKESAVSIDYGVAMLPPVKKRKQNK